MSAAFSVPFNFKPDSISVQTSDDSADLNNTATTVNYTVPSNRYALVNWQTSVSISQGSTSSNIPANESSSGSFWCPASTALSFVANAGDSDLNSNQHTSTSSISASSTTFSTISCTCFGATSATISSSTAHAGAVVSLYVA